MPIEKRKTLTLPLLRGKNLDMNSNKTIKLIEKKGKKYIITATGEVKRLNDGRTVDMEALLRYITNPAKLTLQEIAKIMNVTPQAISKNIKYIGLSKSDIGKFLHFKENKGIYLEREQFRIVNQLSVDEPKGRDLRDGVIALATLIDKQQLLEGKPTSIDFGLIAHVRANNERDMENKGAKAPIDAEFKTVSDD